MYYLMFFFQDKAKPPPTTFELYIQLLETIIWPLVLFAVMIIFRKRFSSAMNRMGSFKASSTGITIDFNDKISEAKDVFKNITEGATAKSGGLIDPNGTGIPKTPYDDLMNLRSQMDLTLKEKATALNMPVDGFTTSQICHRLKDIGAIPLEKAKMIHTILDLIYSAKKDVKQNQVDQIRELYKEIKL